MMRRCMWVLNSIMIIFLLLLLQYHHVAAATLTENTRVTTSTKHLSGDHMQQKLALYQFKLSFSINTSWSRWCDEYYNKDNSSWHPKALNWSMDSDYCKWEGVACNQRTGDVIGLDLSCRHLVGTIYPNSTLFQLPHLQSLYLDCNDFHGVIPEQVFHLPNLKILSLWFDDSNPSISLPKLKWGCNTTLQSLSLINIGIIGGVIPEEVFHLPNLKDLFLRFDDATNPSVSLPKLKWGCNTTLQSLFINISIIGGVIPEEVFYLPNLNFLYLFFDSNVSVSLPKLKWGSSTTLGRLELSGINIIGGVLPDSMGDLNSLYSLTLLNCNLSGPFPESITNLAQLNDLTLDGNHLSGQIPASLANLQNLEFLYLGKNNLHGEFPIWLANLTRLISLDLTGNSLTGPLPSYIPPLSFPSLGELYIDSNQFTGTIPTSFSGLVKLYSIDISSNNFSGVLDLDIFSHLPHLQALYLSPNIGLSLSITSTTSLSPGLQTLWLPSFNITKFPDFIKSFENLTYLDLSNNQIDGDIPNWFGRLTSVIYLNLSHNSLTGGLEHLTWNYNLEYLDLQSNKFSGSLPVSICNMTSLDVLNLSHNNLSGVLPKCPSSLDYALSVFDLGNNTIQGSLPSELSNFQKLRTLKLHDNQLKGTIPHSFSQLDHLEVLDLINNHINDTFPHCLEALQNLQVLVLKSNNFHGIINNYSKVEHPFPSLRIIDLSHNQFSGPLPAKYIKNFKGMMNEEVNKMGLHYMGNNYYSDSVSLVIKGIEVELVKIQTLFTTIDLSRNTFEGEIPEYIGNLKSLVYLNLSHNHLKYNIPSMIGKLSKLESLDLSFNRLVGEIPPQLVDLYFLERLNLSQNALSGHIPEGNQFKTFENDSYVGNSMLCGYPLSKKCIRDNIEQQEEEDDDDYFFDGFTWKAVLMGYASGMMVGIIGGYIMFIVGKPKWYVGIIAIELGLKVRRMEIRSRYV